MAKCPTCGSEYYSSEGRCFASAEKTKSPEVGKRVETKVRWRRYALLGFGLTVFVLGIVGALNSITRRDSGTELGPHLVANMFVVLSAVGVFLGAFSHFGSRVPMWMIHDGHEPDCRKAGALTSLGIALIALISGAAAVANHFERLSSYELSVAGLFLQLSCIAVLVGFFRRPSFLFREDERAYIPARERHVAGAWIVMGGLVTIFLLDMFDALAVGVIFSFILIASGIVVALVPGFRPWLSTGYEKMH